jgi:hypothetical protein
MEQRLRPSSVTFRPAGQYGEDRFVHSWVDTHQPVSPLLQVIGYNNGDLKLVGELELPRADMYSFKIIYRDEEKIGQLHFVDPKQEGERYDIRYPVYVPR